MERTYHSNGQVKEEMWNCVRNDNGVTTYHNYKGPAYQSWYITGQRKSIMYQVHNRHHNDNGPAYQSWHFNPNFTVELKPWEDQMCIPKKIDYYVNGQYHREDGPAIQEWTKSGQLIREDYIVNGQLHREDGPTFREWYDNGQLSREEYYINNALHREDGPARQEWDVDGKIKHVSYMLNGMLQVSDNEPNAQTWENGLLAMTSWHLGDNHYKVNHYKRGILIDTVYRHHFRKHRRWSCFTKMEH